MTLRAVVLGCVLVACASAPVSLPAYDTAVDSEHPRYPQARRSAWDKVTAQAVEAAVRDALKGTVLGGE